MKFKSQAVWAAVAVVLFAAGCKGSDSGDTAQATGATAGTPPPAAAPGGGGAPAAAGVTGDKFADVQKITTASCAGCHGGPRPKAGVDLSSYESIMKGGRGGPIVVAGDPASSLIYKAVSGAAGVRKMPPMGALAPESVQTISAWIKAGAKND